MVRGLDTSRFDGNNRPYLAQWYARLGIPLNQRPTEPNDLRNALNNYSYHLNNRKNIGQRRPNQI